MDKKLQTLKDIKLYREMDAVHLKQSAIEDIRILVKVAHQEGEFSPFDYPVSVEDCDSVIDYIRWKFNISDEEIQEYFKEEVFHKFAEHVDNEIYKKLQEMD